MITKPDKIPHKNFSRPISLINRQKILNKILVNCIQQYIKSIVHHDYLGFIPGIQEFFNIHKSISVIHHINKLKNKNHMIISVDVEIFFDIIQYPFMIITLQEDSIKGTYLNMPYVTNTQLTSFSMVKS